jgi:transglutaminase-like putative cysteine protease
MEDIDLSLKPTVVIESDHPKVKEIAYNLAQRCKNDRDKAVKLFYFVRDSIRYNPYIFSLLLDDFKASNVLEKGQGYCVQKAVLMAALGRAVGIPTKLAFAAIRNHKMTQSALEVIGSNVAPCHGYNYLFIEGKWVSASPTFGRAICEGIGVPTVDFDGIHDATLPPEDLKGGPYIEYLERYGSFNDLPLEWIIEKESK